jgi:hypothetical protein
MSLVFGSVFLFILISPGLIFRFSYLQGTYAKLTFKVSAVEEVFWALVPALFMQVAGILVVENLFHRQVRLDVFYSLITGRDAIDFNTIRPDLLPFLLYLAAVILVSVILGVTTRLVVRKLKLDLYLAFLRFGNEWYYLLSGEILNLAKRPADPGAPWFTPVLNYLDTLRKPKARIELIQVDALINSSEGNFIYSGILENFFLSKDNGLDRIYLSNVYRRRLKDDLDADAPNVGYLARHLDTRYYSMPGYLFVATYDKIINMNITYYTDLLRLASEIQSERESGSDAGEREADPGTGAN